MSRSIYQHYQPWRRYAEVGFWVAAFAIAGTFNSIAKVMDVRRGTLNFPAWEPAVWESTSALALLLLVPFVVWLTRRFALQWRDWRRLLVVYFVASVVYSVAHVLIMVALRHTAYAVMGASYDFGPWPRELLYEYLKDFRTFLVIVLVIDLYRFAFRRLQGEARLLDMPDDASAEEASELPERFLVKMLGREFLVPARRIEWAQAAGNYVNLRVGEREYPLRSTLAGLVARLDPARFVRVHRSYLVNLDHVVEIEPLESGDARVHMRGGAMVPCSRRHRDKLRERVS